MNTEKEEEQKKAITIALGAISSVLQEIAAQEDPVTEVLAFLRHIGSYRTLDILSLTIDDLRLSVRTTNALQSASLLTVQDVLSAQSKSIDSIKNLGREGQEEIWDRFRALGFILTWGNPYKG